MSLEARFVCGAAEDAEIWADVAAPGAVIDTLPVSAEMTELVSVVGSRLPADRRTVLVGHSLGAAVSLLLAANHTSQIAGVVVVACGIALPVHPVIWSTLETDGEGAVAALLARSAVPQSPDGDVAVTSKRMSEMMARANPGTLTAHLRACAAFGAEPISCPAVVLAGALDRVVAPQLSLELANLIGAQLVVLEGVGHQVPWDRPGAVSDALGGILATAWS